MMVSRYRRFGSALLAITLLTVGVLAGSNTPAGAETSYHKLKKKLRRLERTTGHGLQDFGEGLAEGLSEMDFEISFDDEDGPSRPATVRNKPTAAPPVKTATPPAPVPAQPKVAPPVNSIKPLPAPRQTK
jgi:hypothetical protein